MQAPQSPQMPATSPPTFDVIKTPIGFLVVVLSGTAGLARIEFADGPTPGPRGGLRRRLESVRHQLAEYFAGQRPGFDLPIERPGRSSFAGLVLEVTAQIPYGHTATYGDVAERAGRPRAARAAGRALGANPLPIVIPCHRVVRRSGDPGGYGGGAWRKEFLLSLEAGAVATGRAGP